MSRSLTIAILCTNFHKESTGGRVFEEEVLNAALAAPTRHKLVVYPASAQVSDTIARLGIAHRVSTQKLLKTPLIPRRLFRRAKRTVLRKMRPLPFAELTSVLRSKGADCAWMLGGTLAPLDLPYIATIWDLQHRVQPWFPEVSEHGEWRKREHLYEEFIKRAAGLVVGTAVGAQQVRDAYGDAAQSTAVVPLPTPSFALEAGLRPRSARPADMPHPYLLYPAQFWAHKNHVTAVHALRLLQEFPDAPDLVLIGNDRGNRAHVMNEAREAGVEHRIRVLDFVDQARLVSYYQHAEALLFPSLFGPDNLPPLEAMALGCPVIAARVPGAEEQIGDAGILVDGLSPASFANAVHGLREDRHRRDELVERGRARARSWTVAQYAASVFSLFESRIAPMRSLWP